MPNPNVKRSFSNTKRILAVLFGVGFIVGFLLTPLGFETRMHELRSSCIPVFFITVGLVLPLAGLVLLFFKPKIAGVLAVIDAAFMFLTAPADQVLVFFTVAPPPIVTAGEFLLIFVGIGFLMWGPRIFYESRISKKTGPNPDLNK
jgi:hypothetical protein